MDINQATQIFNAYTKFSADELGKVKGDLKKADAVARFQEGGEDHNVSVVAATDDKIHKFSRSPELKNSNRVAHEKFVDAVLTLLNKQSVNDLDPHLQQAFAEMSTPERPLSARRIHIIASEVKLALGAKGENAALNESVAKAGSGVRQTLIDFVNGKTNDVMPSVKDSLSAKLAAIKDELAPEDRAVVAGELAELENLIAGATDVRKLVDDLQTARKNLAAKFNGRLGQREFAPGTHKCAVSFTLLKAFPRVYSELEKNVFLLDVKTVRENVASLLQNVKSEAERAYLTRIQDAVGEANIGNLDQSEVNKLLFESDPQYVNVVRNQVKDIVDQAIKNEKELIQSEYEQRDEQDRPEMVGKEVESQVGDESVKKLEQSVWSDLTNRTQVKITDDNLKEVRGAFRDVQNAFEAEQKRIAEEKYKQLVEDANKQIGENVRGAIGTEKKRIADAGPEAGDFKVELLTKEEEDEFIAEQMRKYGETAVEQAKKGEKVRLPQTDIEDDYARTYSQKVKDQALVAVNKAVTDLKEQFQSINDEIATLENDITQGTERADETLKTSRTAVDETKSRLKSELLKYDVEILKLKKSIDDLSYAISGATLKQFGKSFVQLLNKKYKTDDEIKLEKQQDLLQKLETNRQELVNQIDAAEEDYQRDVENDGLKRSEIERKRIQKEELESFVKNEVSRLDECADRLSRQIKNTETPDVAVLEKMVNRFRRSCADVGAAAGKLLKGEDVPKDFKPVSPEELNVYGRYGLHNTPEFVRRAARNLLGYLHELVKAELPKDKAGLVNDAVKLALNDKDRFPKFLLDKGIAFAKGQTNESIVSGKIEDYLELYVKTLIDNVKNGTIALKDGDALPDLGDDALKTYEAKAEASGGRGEEAVSVSVFGNEAKLKTAINLLGQIDGDEARGLKVELEALAKGFTASGNSARYASSAFDKRYFNLFLEKLNEQVGGTSDSKRDYLTLLLNGIGKARDLTLQRNKVTVIENVREFLKIASPLAAEAEKTAYDETVKELGTAKELLGIDGMTTLDRDTLVAAFCKTTGMSEKDFPMLSADKIKALRPYVEFVKSFRNRDESVVPPSAFSKFTASLLGASMPWSLLDPAKNEGADRMLRDFVNFQRLIDSGEKGEFGQIDRLVDGLGTMDAKEILVGLAKDGLLKLPYRAYDPKGNHPSTVEIVSLLYNLNGKRFGGLNEICRQVFGCGVAEVDSKQYAAVLAKIRDNHRRHFAPTEGLGAFEGVDHQTFVQADGEIRKVSGLLTIGIRSLFGGKTKPEFSSLRDWLFALDNLAEGIPQSIEIAGTKVELRVTTGSMMSATLTPQGMNKPVTVYIDNCAKALARNIRETALYHAKDYSDAVDRTNLAGMLIDAGKSGSRELALSALKGLVNADSVSLAKVPTSTLVETARGLITGTVPTNKFSIAKLIAAAPKDRIESEEVLDMIDRYDQAPIVEQSRIEILESDAKRPETVRDFAAELVSSSENWLTDRVGERPAKLRVVLESNRALLERLAQMDGKTLEKEIGALGSEDLGKAVKAALAAFKSAGLEVKGISEEALTSVIKSVDSACTAQMDALQAEFEKNFVKKLVSAGFDDPDLMSLGDMAGTDSIDLNGGYGGFLKETLSNYFSTMNDIDKRTMFASFLRGTGEKSTVVDRITALVKGAGPIFVKIMQGIPEKAVPVEYRTMMSVVKGLMPHIPEKIVKAQMLDLIASSNGLVTGITVVKSIGAASVGEAFLCRVKTAENPDGEECVIKLLRPEVQNRAKREEAFLLSLPSQGKAFQSRLGSIFDELDLKHEAENVEISSIYDEIDPGMPSMARVKTMRLHPILRPSAMSLVAQKAPGDTVDNYFKSLDARLEDLLKPVKRTETVGPGDKAFRNTKDGEVVAYRARSHKELTIVKDRLHKFYKEALQRQNDLVNLATKWVEAALFPPGGRPGFIHGDLHDRNAMTSSGVMSFIDFGNAMEMTEEENKALVKGLFYCVNEMKDNFISVFKGSPFKLKFPPTKSDSYEKLMAAVDSAFKKGGSNDSGLRFAALISSFQKYDVDIPPVLYGFTQSMLRIQNAIDRANEAVSKIAGVYQDLRLDSPETIFVDPFLPKDFDVRLDNVDPSNGSAIIKSEVSKLDSAWREKFSALCLDQNGQFSPELVKSKLLPIAEHYRDVYSIDVFTEEVPSQDQRLGEQLYQLVKELSETKLDLSGGASSADMLRFNQFADQFVRGYNEVIYAVTSNCDQMATVDNPVKHYENEIVPVDIRQTLLTFPVVFQSCVWKHAEKCKSMFSGGEYFSLLRKAGEIRKRLDKVDAETSNRLAVEKRNREFLAANPKFPVDVVRTITVTSAGKFVFEDKAFDKKDLPRMAKIIKENVLRLKNVLVDNANYDISKDAELWGGKKSVELAMNHWGASNGVFDKMKTLNEEKTNEVTKLKQIVNADTASLTAEERELVCYAIDHLLATNPANLV